jgi:hypothetical protein
MLVENPKGDYSFVRGIGPFSAAVIARPGFEIVHARFLPLVPLVDGFTRVESHLRGAGRPIHALCGMELRIPEPLSRQAFDEFNRPYVERLDGWGLKVGSDNPVTRTNVAYEINTIREAMLAGFYYTTAATDSAPSFVLSGAPEIASREGGMRIIASGDTSAEGLRLKAECIIEVLGKHLVEMQVSWRTATAVNLYTVHDLHRIMSSTLLPVFDDAAHGGITWHYSRPPVTGLEVEIDARAVRIELVLR